jgi:thioesterase domain-containing protein
MAEEFVHHVRSFQSRGPYYLAGYSAGGLAAYEMACILEAMGERVAVLILFDTFNPSAPRWSPAERIQAHVDKLRERGPGYISNRVIDRLQRGLDVTRRLVGARLARHAPFRFRHEALVSAGMEAERVYRPEPYSGHVLLLQADWRLTAGDGIGYRPHESNGWRGYVNGRLDVVQIACSHTDVVSEKASPLAAAEVRRVLAQARQRYEPGIRSGTEEPAPRSSRRVMTA